VILQSEEGGPTETIERINSMKQTTLKSSDLSMVPDEVALDPAASSRFPYEQFPEVDESQGQNIVQSSPKPRVRGLTADPNNAHKRRVDAPHFSTTNFFID
jgi:hypothetical protein